jgi:hypothetical protein
MRTAFALLLFLVFLATGGWWEKTGFSMIGDEGPNAAGAFICLGLPSALAAAWLLLKR